MGSGGLLSRRLGLLFFIEFLKVSGLFDAWVKDCPLIYSSNNVTVVKNRGAGDNTFPELEVEFASCP